jgi:hypothetical protein
VWRDYNVLDVVTYGNPATELANANFGRVDERYGATFAADPERF